MKILENNNKSNNLEELFAFLGVNGAGKSTTISILCGLQKKDSGTVQVNGIETDKAGAQTKRMLGVVFQDSVLDKPLTVKENLKSRAALYGITGNWSYVKKKYKLNTTNFLFLCNC